MMKTVIFDIKNENGGIPIVGKNEKLESPKFESLADVGKSQANLETIDRCWTEPTEVGKFLLKLEIFAAIDLSKLNSSFPTSLSLSKFNLNFPTSKVTFQLQFYFPASARVSKLQLELSNFNRFFPTSLGPFQLRLALSDFSEIFQLQTFQLNTFQILVLSNLIDNFPTLQL